MKINQRISCLFSLICLFILAAFYSTLAQDFKPFREPESIPPGKAVIYIYWPSRVIGAYFFIRVNDKPASDLPLYSKGCLIYFADPGVNVINIIAKDVKKGDLVVQVNEGEQVFVKGLFRTGETTFRIVSKDNALRELDGCHLYGNPAIIDSDKLRSIALVSTTMSKPIPGAGMMDESTYHQFAEPRMKKLIELEKLTLPRIRESVAAEMRKCFKGTILYGDTLNLKPEMASLKEKYHTCLTFEANEKSYPVLISLTDDLLPFPEYKTEMDWFFNHPDNYKKNIAEIGAALKTDIIAFSNTNYDVYADYIYLTTRLYFFKNDGTLLLDGKYSMKEYNTIGRTMEDFENALKLFPCTFTFLLEDFTGKFNKRISKY